MRNLYLRIYFGLIAIVIWSITSIAIAQNVLINEFMALNESVLVDEDQAYSDWIEISCKIKEFRRS